MFLLLSIVLHGKYFSTWEQLRFSLCKNKSHINLEHYRGKKSEMYFRSSGYCIQLFAFVPKEHNIPWTLCWKDGRLCLCRVRQWKEPCCSKNINEVSQTHGHLCFNNSWNLSDPRPLVFQQFMKSLRSTATCVSTIHEISQIHGHLCV